MGTPPLFIFDLDGTLANIEHRLHMVKPVDDNEGNWPGFFEACDADGPKWKVIQTLDLLVMGGAEIWIFSGRSEVVRDKTVKWLLDHIGIDYTNDPRLVMRPANNTEPDDELKQSWLENMLEIDRARLVAVFDDRKRVVDMWRRNGLVCFQVEEGLF